MAEQIYTIPINEAFDEYDGCPVCRLRAKLETSSLNYIMGAAMMEPDVRIVTNKLGFCKNHFHRMLAMGNRLSMALTLESHLDSVISLFPDTTEGSHSKLAKIRKYNGSSPADALYAQTQSCFVCQRAAEAEKKYIANIIYIWKKDNMFQEKLSKQPFICLEHTALLLQEAKSSLREENYLKFAEELIQKSRDYLKDLRSNITSFCRSFDHENAGKPLSQEQKKAVEASVAYLSGDFEY